MEDLKIFLKQIGFEKEDIEDISELVNNEIDTKELYKKVEYLKEIGCEARVIRIVIEENILFLSTELEEMKKVISFLKANDLEEYIVNLIEVNPEILSVSAETLNRNVNLIKMMVSDDKIKILLRDRIELFTYNTDYLSQRLAFLVNNGLKEKIGKLILMQIEIFELEEDEIEIEELKKNL